MSAERTLRVEALLFAVISLSQRHGQRRLRVHLQGDRPHTEPLQFFSDSLTDTSALHFTSFHCLHLTLRVTSALSFHTRNDNNFRTLLLLLLFSWRVKVKVKFSQHFNPFTWFTSLQLEWHRLLSRLLFNVQFWVTLSPTLQLTFPLLSVIEQDLNRWNHKSKFKLIICCNIALVWVWFNIIFTLPSTRILKR